MIRTPVSSSNLASVGYEPGTYVLEVEFNNGRVYQYLDVPQAHYDSLMMVPSVGAYFNANIRDSFTCIPM